MEKLSVNMVSEYIKAKESEIKKEIKIDMVSTYNKAKKAEINK